MLTKREKFHIVLQEDGCASQHWRCCHQDHQHLPNMLVTSLSIWCVVLIVSRISCLNTLLPWLSPAPSPFLMQCTLFILGLPALFPPPLFDFLCEPPHPTPRVFSAVLSRVTSSTLSLVYGFIKHHLTIFQQLPLQTSTFFRFPHINIQ